ncbi:MAG TPA: membrane protein insertase YidC [Longimicrobiales bacterium]|nr:membrane protein insertase YidC [Longimicrobiales bacterium]
MKTEVRFMLAIGLMLLVLVGTNLIFPPVVPDEALQPDSVATEVESPAPQQADRDPVLPPSVGATPGVGTEDLEVGPLEEERLTVEGPLYRFTFSDVGARLVSAEMLGFRALNRDGLVDLIPEGAGGYLGQKLLVGTDTVDLTRVRFQVDPASGVFLTDGGGPRELRFSYQHPTRAFGMELTYEFRPEAYQVLVRGTVTGVDRPLLLTELGDGVSFAEADSAGEARAMAYVFNHVRDGIESRPLTKAQPELVEGPLLWSAFKSKFFVMALLAGESEAGASETDYLGGLLVGPSELGDRVRVTTAQSIRADGTFSYRLFMGPQDYGRLSSLGEDMQEVNPYGWRFFRPIVRPFVSVIMAILTFLHSQFSLGYGWVLIVFGVLMRVVLWPLNQKAMRAQLKNMAVQPLLQEIQAKHKDNPERLQKEMMKLYKEHGFNPLAGCWPMLLPWPVLIALFFVFQNTIQLRGEAFLWLPDLSAPDPLYILPVFMGASMFAMQYVSMKTVPQTNQQMKMMMYIMPVMMVFIFFNLASGLNLYYATANIATIPQQIWINRERKKMQGATLGTLPKKG